MALKRCTPVTDAACVRVRESKLLLGPHFAGRYEQVLAVLSQDTGCAALSANEFEQAMGAIHLDLQGLAVYLDVRVADVWQLYG